MLCIANQRTGVGKTTTSVNLAVGLARAGLRTLVVDLDPRGPATQHLLPAVNKSTRTRTSSTYVPGCDLMPASTLSHEVSQQRLGNLLEELDDKSAYDWVLLDCPPSTAAMTSSALEIAEELLMPICCDDFGMDGVADFVSALRAAMGEGSQVEFSGVLMTHCQRTPRALDFEREAREFFGEVVLDTVIPFDQAIEDARRSQRAVMDVAPRSRGTRAYLELCREVLER